MLKCIKRINFNLLTIFVASLLTTAYFIYNIKLNTTSIEIYDLNEPILQIEKYNNISCRKSIEIHKITTTLCYHSQDKDGYVSRIIAEHGIWEKEFVEIFLKYLLHHDDWLAFDIGANVGTYTLFAAKAGKRVVAVEAFRDNLLVIKKAATFENTMSRMTLINNALSNESNKIELLNVDKANVGGQGLLKNKGKKISEQELMNEQLRNYFVRTILFDELVDYLPRRDDGSKYKKGIMKIDIEGSEPLALEHATKLFEEIDFQVIIMEWVSLVGTFRGMLDTQTLKMLEFLYSRGFKVYSLPNKGELKREDWKSWPMDIIWIK